MSTITPCFYTVSSLVSSSLSKSSTSTCCSSTSSPPQHHFVASSYLFPSSIPAAFSSLCSSTLTSEFFLESSNTSKTQCDAVRGNESKEKLIIEEAKRSNRSEQKKRIQENEMKKEFIISKQNNRRKKRKNKQIEINEENKQDGKEKKLSFNNFVLCCHVCQSKEGKYKFKCCEKKFCSVACFKRHDIKLCLEDVRRSGTQINNVYEKKRTNEMHNYNTEGKKHIRIFSDCKEKIEEAGEDEVEKEEKRNVNGEDENKVDDFENEYVLTEEEKYFLMNNIKLRRYFEDKTLRSFLRQIAAAKSRRKEVFGSFLNDKLFNNFVDEVMSTIQSTS